MMKSIANVYLKYLNLIFSIILCCIFSTDVNAQFDEERAQRQLHYEQNIQKNYCGTMDLDENLKRPEDIEVNPGIQLRSSGGTWNLSAGYGASCANDCTITGAATCTGGGDIFRMPVVYTVSTATGCATTQASQATLDAQIDIMNDFFVCQNIPIEFYQCQTPRFQNLGCTYDANNVTNIPDVANIYVFSNTGNGAGCNGFAFLPGGTSSPTTIVMSFGCYNGFTYTPGSINCSDPVLGAGGVLIHEFGHYLGLYHTHGNYSPGPNFNYPGNGGNGSAANNYYGEITAELVDGSNACTEGDFIEDTNADLGISHSLNGQGTPSGTPPAVPNPVGGCASNNGCTVTFSCTDANGDNYLSANYTIMSYGFCENTFTPCQKAKMVDALLCARGPQKCCRDVNAEFTNGLADANQSICLGDPIPTFSTIGDCYVWYDGLGGTANVLTTGMTFTPNSTQVDVNTIGTYEFYLGDLNEINPDCRTLVSVEVLSDPGQANIDGGSTLTLTSCPQSVDLTTDVMNLGTNELVGWWFTQDNPISTIVVDLSSLNANMPTVSSTFGVGNIVESTAGTPLNELNISIDCNSIDNTKTYYATPVVSNSRAVIPDSQCTINQNATNGVTFNGFPGKYNSISPSSICVPTPVCDPPTYDFCVTVSGYTGNPANLCIIIRDDNFFGSTLLSDWFIGSGDGTYCYDYTQMIGYDPGDPSWTTGMTVIVWEQGGSGMANATIPSELDITYPGKPAIPFPSLSDYSDCLFGPSISIDCDCGSPPACPPNYPLSGAGSLPPNQTTSADYETDGFLESAQLISGTSTTVDYDSGTSIELENGFEIQIGAVFHAFIDGCGGAMFSDGGEDDQY